MGNRIAAAPVAEPDDPEERVGLLGRAELAGDSLTRVRNDPSNLLHRVATLSTSSGLHPVFLCGICLCYEDNLQACTVSGCNHRFCKTCLTRYVTSQITDGQPYMQCPAIDDEDGTRCRTVLSPADIECLVTDRALLSKFWRFKASRDNPDNRACPRCNYIQMGNAQVPEMTCIRCGKEYCFAHGDAHDRLESCQQFEERCKAQDEESLTFVRKTSKPCPGCEVQTYKFTGCNHMKCPRCDTDWCWLCGEQLVITGPYLNHYDRRNALSPCAGKQFTPDENEEPQRHSWCYRICYIIFFYSPLAIPFYLLAVVVYIILTIVCLPRLCTNAESRANWLRPVLVVHRIVGCFWVLTAVILVSIITILVFLVTWALGLVIGLLCLPFSVVCRRFSTAIQALTFCCCCWAPILLATLAHEQDEDVAED